MAPLTESQIAGIREELLPHISSDEAKTSLGVSVYKAFLGAHPEYIQHFSKLNGLTIDNVFESEGIKYYGRTLVDELLTMLNAGADDEKLQQLMNNSAKAHTARNIDNAKFMSGLPIFIDYFNNTLTVPENQTAMKAFLNHVFPAISKDL